MDLILLSSFCLFSVFFIGFVTMNVKTAYKRFNIKRVNGIYTVRDRKGRFVTITDNWWNIAKLGL